MADLPVSQIDDQDQSYWHESQREVWQQNRRLRGDPLCTVYVKTYADADPLTGHEGTPTVTVQHEDLPCWYAPADQELVAQSAGLIQPSDIKMVLYDVADEFDPLWRVTVEDNRSFQIINQNYRPESQRLELDLRPIEEQDD